MKGSFNLSGFGIPFSVRSVDPLDHHALLLPDKGKCPDCGPASRLPLDDDPPPQSRLVLDVQRGSWVDQHVLHTLKEKLETKASRIHLRNLYCITLCISKFITFG